MLYRGLRDRCAELLDIAGDERAEANPGLEYRKHALMSELAEK